MPHKTSIITPQINRETEWWYYHGHLESDHGKLGFHLVFFRRKTDHITIGRFIRGKHFCDHAWFAHMSICEIDQNASHYAQRRSQGGSSPSGRKVWVRDWSIHEKDNKHILKAASRDHGIELTLSPVKNLSENHGSNSFEKTPGDATNYSSITRMDVTGTVNLHGKQFPATGNAWMDRECGPFKLNHHLQGWDWFAIQANDGHELMLYRMKDSNGNTTPSSLTLLHTPDGTLTNIHMDEWQLTPTRHWTSHITQITYPVDWHLQHTGLEIDLHIKACVDCSEIDARGSSCIIYWEGPATANGKLLGRDIQANTFMELVGYNDKVKTGTYDYANENLPLLDWLYCSARYFLRHSGVTHLATDAR